MKIVKKTHISERGLENITVVIRRPFAHLEKELSSAFKGQEDVKVILDRRYGERRKRSLAVAEERRKAGRRRQNEEIVEVVFPI
jgi:hypothetical protein